MTLRTILISSSLGSLAGILIWSAACLSDRKHLTCEEVRSAETSADIDKCQAFYTVLTLLWRAESSNGKQMIGDGGLARGHFQQHEGHWHDGCERLGADWAYPKDTHNLAKAAAVTAANWARYAPDALKSGNVEMLVRQHRKPNDPYGSGQDEYLDRVMKGIK